MRQLTQTLYYKISAALLVLLIALGSAQLMIFYFFWGRVVNESEQLVSWGLAREIAPRFQALLDADADYWDLSLLARQVSESNPRIDIYFLDEKGNIQLDFLVNDLRIREAVNILPVRSFVEGNPAPALPVYGDDPAQRVGSMTFSAAPLRFGGKSGYLYVVLRNARWRKLEIVYAENSAFRVSVSYFVLSLAAAASIGLVLFFFMTKRFHRVTEVVRQFESGNFSERLVVKTADEIDGLARAVNQMADTIVRNIAELENRDELRRDLIANVSHDLRGPVAVINGYIEDILAKLDTVSKQEIAERAGIIRKNSLSLKQLLGELFELAKLEARESKISPEPFAAAELVESQVRVYAQQAADLGLELCDETPERIPWVVGDVVLIERVLGNLIENALRYTPEGGKIALRCTPVPEGVTISVSDTGIGIPEADLPHVFERFYRVKTSSPRSGISTGLGLAIVYRAIQAHGRTISVKSQEGKGTVFSFTLPVFKPPAV